MDVSSWPVRGRLAFAGWAPCGCRRDLPTSSVPNRFLARVFGARSPKQPRSSLRQSSNQTNLESAEHFGVRVFSRAKIRAIRGFDRLAPVLYILGTQLRAPPHGIGELCQCAGGLLKRVAEWPQAERESRRCPQTPYSIGNHPPNLHMSPRPRVTGPTVPGWPGDRSR